jgi:alpha-glucosidase
VFDTLAVDQQDGVAGSTLELYRTLLSLRREHRLGRGELAWHDSGEHVLDFEVTTQTGAPVRLIANLGEANVPLPEGVDVLVCSADVDLADGLPTDCAAWLR